ncbi:MAG: ADP-ribosylglycohydrolase family protein [Muribaculaceae bacterium]|nr:ADP-ribosylglycohydrolase family protein [Muribaculaceae bacterium]
MTIRQAEESFAITVFCVAHIDDFNQCVIPAVNHGGDSDSTGAIAGNIIGSVLGYNAIPRKYRKQLQNIDLIEFLCNESYENNPEIIQK